MKDSTAAWASAIGGVVLGLVSGVVNSTPGGLVGAGWYGYPVAWLYKLVIAPQYNPWKVSAQGLVIDILFWFVVLAVILLILRKAKK